MWYDQEIYWNVLCRDRGERCGAANNKLLIKADTEQTKPEKRHQDTHTHRHRNPMKRD